MPTNCAEGTIMVYEPSAAMPWNNQRVLHLLRRTGFGATYSEMTTTLTATPETFIDNLIDEATAKPAPPVPYWAYYTFDDFGGDIELNFVEAYYYIANWVSQLANNGLREKLVLFWSNHFVTQFDVYEFAPFLYQYHDLLHQHAMGNFRDFVRAIGLDPAMLLYLNGAENTQFTPNENYSRELFELFTLGEGIGYTQTDIVETSRAFTGYTIDPETFTQVFVPFLHDGGSKTIFGQTGNWDYDDVIDILFEQRGELIAHFICQKLYTFFIHPNPAEEIVAELTQTFLDNDFELTPVLRQLFKSEHFFDTYNMGQIIKSPADMMIGFIREIDGPIEEVVIEEGGVEITGAMVLFDALQTQNQNLFSPIDVAGWPGNRAWLNNNTLTARWKQMDDLALFLVSINGELFRNLAINLSDNSNDPEVVTQAIVNYFIPQGLQTLEAYELATDVFKWEIPDFYFDAGLWSLGIEEAKFQVAILISHIARLPEFQLF